MFRAGKYYVNTTTNMVFEVLEHNERLRYIVWHYISSAKTSVWYYDNIAEFIEYREVSQLEFRLRGLKCSIIRD